MGKTYSSNPILAEFRAGFDEYDSWGATIGAHFTIAEAMTREGESVPADWQFRMGPAIFSTPEWAWLEDNGFIGQVVLDATEDERLFAGRVVAKYGALLREAGKDY